jgi:hypothetical protein
MQAPGEGVRRKTWERGVVPVLKETEGRNEALSSAGVDPSYREYLAVMQEKNRILKEMRRKEEERQAALLERERGFELNFTGANEERLRLKEKEKQQTSNKRFPLRGPVGTANSASQGKIKGPRSQWMMGSVHILTERGSVVILQPPGKNQQRESMQWLMSEEGRGWLEVFTLLFHAYFRLLVRC